MDVDLWLSAGQLQHHLWLSRADFGCPRRTDNHYFDCCSQLSSCYDSRKTCFPRLIFRLQRMSHPWISHHTKTIQFDNISGVRLDPMNILAPNFKNISGESRVELYLIEIVDYNPLNLGAIELEHYEGGQTICVWKCD